MNFSTLWITPAARRDPPERDQRHHGDDHAADVEAHRDLQHRPEVDRGGWSGGSGARSRRPAVLGPRAPPLRRRRRRRVAFPSRRRPADAGDPRASRGGGRTAVSGPMSSATLPIGLRCPLRSRSRLRAPGPRPDRLAVVQPGDPHPGGVAALRGDLVDAHADDVAAGREHEDLVVGRHRERGHHGTPGGGDPHAPHALAAAALAVELRRAGCACRGRWRSRTASPRRRGPRRSSRPRPRRS